MLCHLSSYSMMLFIVYGGLHHRSQGCISSKTMIFEVMQWQTRKDQLTEYETRAKNLLKAELKRKGVTYAQLAESWPRSVFMRRTAI